jgi:hypothetical protein
MRSTHREVEVAEMGCSEGDEHDRPLEKVGVKE